MSVIRGKLPDYCEPYIISGWIQLQIWMDEWMNYELCILYGCSLLQCRWIMMHQFNPRVWYQRILFPYWSVFSQLETRNRRMDLIWVWLEVHKSKEPRGSPVRILSILSPASKSETRTRPSIQKISKLDFLHFPRQSLDKFSN